MSYSILSCLCVYVIHLRYRLINISSNSKYSQPYFFRSFSLFFTLDHHRFVISIVVVRINFISMRINSFVSIFFLFQMNLFEYVFFGFLFAVDRYTALITTEATTMRTQMVLRVKTHFNKTLWSETFCFFSPNFMNNIYLCDNSSGSSNGAKNVCWSKAVVIKRQNLFSPFKQIISW